MTASVTSPWKVQCTITGPACERAPSGAATTSLNSQTSVVRQIQVVRQATTIRRVDVFATKFAQFDWARMHSENACARSAWNIFLLVV